VKTFIHAASSYQILKLSSEDSKLEKKNRKKDRGFHIIEDYSATLSEAQNEILGQVFHSVHIHTDATATRCTLYRLEIQSPNWHA